MHPCKRYWVEANINTTTNTKSKKGHNSVIILRMITNIKLDLYFTMGHTSAKFKKKSMHPCKSYWSEININTSTKTKSKKGHNSARIWRVITNIELDLYFYSDIKFFKSLMKSIHPFKSYWTETKSVTTTPTTTSTLPTTMTPDDDDADGQHDPYVSAMLRRWHN